MQLTDLHGQSLEVIIISQKISQMLYIKHKSTNSKALFAGMDGTIFSTGKTLLSTVVAVSMIGCDCYRLDHTYPTQKVSCSISFCPSCMREHPTLVNRSCHILAFSSTLRSLVYTYNVENKYSYSKFNGGEDHINQTPPLLINSAF